MKNSFTLTITSFLAVLLLVGLTSGAIINFEPNILSVSANQNTDYSFNFNLYHDNTNTNIYTLNWSTSNADNGATWKILPTLTLISPGENKSLSATINIPNNFAGIINANLKVAAKNSTTTPYTLPITINVPSSPSISVSSGSVSPSQNSTTLTIKNTGNVALSNIELTQSGDFKVNLSQETISSLAPGAEQQITLTADTSVLSRILGSGQRTTITATSGTTTETGIVSYTGEYCAYNNLGNNIIFEIDDIRVLDGYGDDDEWFPLDKVEVTFLIEYNSIDSDNTLRNAEVRWGLYSTAQNKFIIGEEKESTFRLKDGDDKEIVVTFVLEKPKDYSYSGDYILFAKVTGDDEQFNRAKSCASASKRVTIEIDDTVMISGLNMPTTLPCGATELIKGKLWNIGDEHQEDVRLIIESKDIGLYEDFTYDRIRTFNSEDFEFMLNIPSNYAKSHVRVNFELRDEDGYLFEADGNKMSFSYSVKVDGGCVLVPDVAVTPTLESDAVAGEEIVIKTTILNTGSKQHTIIVSAEGYQSWATLENIDKTTFLLGVGGSEEVWITLKANKDAEGTKNFNLNIRSADGSVYQQPVSVTIKSSGGFSLNNLFGDNGIIWTIAIVNAILIIAIVIVVVRIIRKK